MFLFCFYCVQQNAFYLRRFLVLRVLLCPSGIDRGCQVISGFRRHLGLTDTRGLDPMPERINLDSQASLL